MSRFRISDLAKLDLADIREYIFRDNPDAADKLVASFFKTFHNLAANPRIGRIRPEFSGGDLRVFPVRNYVVFYRIRGNEIEVARVIHGSRDIDSMFSE